MCGIAGFSGSFDRDTLERMAGAIRHRGPDDEGFEMPPGSGVGLAHRRLSIIDLSPAGHQPMWDGSHSVAIVYNGELYNFRELRKDLERDGFAFRGHSDTEVLLNLYMRDGQELLPKLNGIFAFAIWDSRSRSLFLARDQLGVKPLYTAQTSRGFAFASELKSLLHCPGIDRRIDLQAVDAHLHYVWCPSPRTMLESVRKLEPGAAMLVQDGRVRREWRHYRLPTTASLLEGSDAQLAEQVRDAIATAVRRQMVADVPVGSFLSGGLDSSAVVAFARQAQPEVPLRCFTIGFTDPAARREGMAADLPYAEQVARHLGVDLETVWVGPEMVDALPRMLFHLDEPQSDPAPINALFICQLAREQGIKVLLSGAGGDDIFTGYRRHTALLREAWWAWLPQAARRGLAALAGSLPVGGELTRRARKALQYAALEGDERLVSYFSWAPPGMLAGLYTAEAAAALEGHAASRALLDELNTLPAGVHPLNRMLHLEQRFFLADHNLNYTDKMGMATGVEVRVPLLDPELVALAARLPIRAKQRGSTGKWIFRKAMEPLLPASVIHREKAGFGAPLRHWIRGPLAASVAEVLSRESVARRGIFDPDAVAGLVARNAAGRIDASYAIFGMMSIELWCRMFVDPATPTPITGFAS